MAARKKKTDDVFSAHRETYAALYEAQEHVAELARELASRRQDVINEVATLLKDAPGLSERIAAISEQGSPSIGAPGVMMTGLGNADPIAEIVTAAESRYFDQLGGPKPLPPLAIWHVNDWSGGSITCPKCGEEIDHRSEILPPDGTTGRGPRPSGD